MIPWDSMEANSALAAASHSGANTVAGGYWVGSGGLNQMLHRVLDRWKPLAGSHHRLILHKKLLGRPWCWVPPLWEVKV